MEKILNPSTTCTLSEMEELAAKLAKTLPSDATITLTGDLGAGKTTFTSFLCKTLAPNSLVTSPTFTYLNIYNDAIAHFDLYRIQYQDQFFLLGLEEYLEEDFLTIIEWPAVIENILPKDTIDISISHKGSKREVSINGIPL